LAPKNSIKCIAIDDEPLALELLKTYVSKYPELEWVQSFTDAVAGLEFLRSHIPDLLFIDINMPDLNGLELVQALPVKPMVIFTTAYKKFAVDSYDLDAIDYLLKPIEPERFTRAVQKAIEQYRYRNSINKKETESFFVRSEYQLVKIYFDAIEFIESVDDYLKIHLREGRPVMTLMTLKSILEKLPSDQFKRIHRSYIIPLSRIQSVVNRKVRLTKTELPVGDSYISLLQEWMRK
jgi:DNA-binding LytR/AlgR family response regulator